MNRNIDLLFHATGLGLNAILGLHKGRRAIRSRQQINIRLLVWEGTRSDRVRPIIKLEDRRGPSIPLNRLVIVVVRIHQTIHPAYFELVLIRTVEHHDATNEAATGIVAACGVRNNIKEAGPCNNRTQGPPLLIRSKIVVTGKV